MGSASALQSVGNYDLIEKIADGGMGSVYKGRHWQSEEVVAVKILAPEIASNPVLLKRFEQEFRSASRLRHKAMVRMIDYCGSEKPPFLVMEYVDGESLGDLLDRDGPLPVGRAIGIIMQICEGLNYAHNMGLIHRDIKPDNILINREGFAKLTDLGLAKETETAMDLTQTGHGLGTPDYIAPEQFTNAKNASVRCDIYSLGATLYHTITGNSPFNVDDPVQSMLLKLRNEFTSPSQLVPNLPERIEWTIRRAMNPNPDNRQDSCRTFVEDLVGQAPPWPADPVPAADTVKAPVVSKATTRKPTVQTAPGTGHTDQAAQPHFKMPARSRSKKPNDQTNELWTTAMLVGIALLAAFLAYFFFLT